MPFRSAGGACFTGSKQHQVTQSFPMCKLTSTTLHDTTKSKPNAKCCGSLPADPILLTSVVLCGRRNGVHHDHGHARTMNDEHVACARTRDVWTGRGALLYVHQATYNSWCRPMQVMARAARLNNSSQLSMYAVTSA